MYTIKPISHGKVFQLKKKYLIDLCPSSYILTQSTILHDYIDINYDTVKTLFDFINDICGTLNVTYKQPECDSNNIIRLHLYDIRNPVESLTHTLILEYAFITVMGMFRPRLILY